MGSTKIEMRGFISQCVPDEEREREAAYIAQLSFCTNEDFWIMKHIFKRWMGGGGWNRRKASACWRLQMHQWMATVSAENQQK